uniref:Uncharacterized protein n=1 Tax=Glossina austeni TaxID=7395 RepID=A0A1A9VT38_GLOAU
MNLFIITSATTTNVGHAINIVTAITAMATTTATGFIYNIFSSPSLLIEVKGATFGSILLSVAIVSTALPLSAGKSTPSDRTAEVICEGDDKSSTGLTGATTGRLMRSSGTIENDLSVKTFNGSVILLKNKYLVKNGNNNIDGDRNSSSSSSSSNSNNSSSGKETKLEITFTHRV